MKAGFRAIPFDELVHGVPVAALCLGGTEAIQHGGLGLIEIWQPEHCFPGCTPLMVQSLL
jgi:hypothetical protein